MGVGPITVAYLNTSNCKIEQNIIVYQHKTPEMGVLSWCSPGEIDPESWDFVSSTTHKATHVLGRPLAVSRSRRSLATYSVASNPDVRHAGAFSGGVLKVKTTRMCGQNFFMLRQLDGFRTFEWFAAIREWEELGV